MTNHNKESGLSVGVSRASEQIAFAILVFVFNMAVPPG
jgi:hypothetical protein